MIFFSTGNSAAPYPMANTNYFYEGSCCTTILDSHKCPDFHLHYLDNYIKLEIQDKLDAPMPWIGMYIAAAAVVCSITMVADVFKGFKSKKLWFPCKYFSLNATSLTLLAVATKLSVDLTTSMMGYNDKIACLSSLVLMTIAIGNFMTSVASMGNNEMFLNLSALVLLVVTISVNIYIKYSQILSSYPSSVLLLVEQRSVIVSMLLLIILLCSSAIVVPITKRIIKLKFQDMHKMISKERAEGGKLTIHELSTVLKKYWVMAETGNPQFVMARSVFSVIPGFLCLLLNLCLLEAHIRAPLSFNFNNRNGSNYKWSINWILFIQTGGVAIGTIAPVSRWFVVVRFKSSKMSGRSFKDKMKIETYLTQRLIDWRESPLPFRIRHVKFKKALHISKSFLLNVCIKIQILIILASKLVLIFCVMYVDVVFMFFHHMKKLKIHALKSLSGMPECESQVGMETDFSRYVLLLEGEFELPKNTIANMCSEADKLIHIGKTQKPKAIIELLQKSVKFNGLREFDSNEVVSLHEQEPPNCWSLSVVTLTSIAMALPNIPNHKANQLFSGVAEGFSFVKIIEKTIDKKTELISLRNAADIIWVGLELYQKWQDKDVIQRTNSEDQTYKDTLQELSDIAKRTVVDFKNNTTDLLMENPMNWPTKVIAANSMYRTCQTILLAKNNGNNELLFERLSIIISDILAACLTNLASVISMKCQSNAIEKMQENIRHAAILLGESEDVIQFLEQREWPSLHPDKAGYINEWRAVLERNNENLVTSVLTTGGGLIPQSLNEHVSVEIDI